MKTKNKLIYLIFLLVITACEKKIEIDPGDFKPILVVNSLIDTANVIQVQVSKTSIINDNSNSLVNNAQVELWQNGLFLEQLNNVEDGIYKSTLKPEIATAYQLRVSSSGFETLIVSDTIPEPVQISDGYLIFPAGTDIAGDPILEFTTIFKDPPDIDNYYEIVLYAKQVYPHIDSVNLDTIFYGDTTWLIDRERDFISDDPVIIAEGDLDYHPRTIYFSDKLFNGEQSSITIKLLMAYNYDWFLNYSEDFETIAVLRSVSYAYYQYKKTWWRHLYNQGIDLDIQSTDEFRAFLFTGEPVNMYSNVQNGYGIFAGFSESSIVLRRILKK